MMVVRAAPWLHLAWVGFRLRRSLRDALAMPQWHHH
jgi:hypothetical protein